MDQRKVLTTTERLVVRWFTEDDAAFVVEQLNQPSFIQNIGDRGVRTLDDARRYLSNGPLASYEKHGFGLNAVELDGVVIGMCGVLKREALEHPDLGFAFLPPFWSKGYAREAATAVMLHAREILRLGRILAITSLNNIPSISLLEKLGFQFEQLIRMPGDEEQLRLFVNDRLPGHGGS